MRSSIFCCVSVPRAPAACCLPTFGQHCCRPRCGEIGGKIKVFATCGRSSAESSSVLFCLSTDSVSAPTSLLPPPPALPLDRRWLHLGNPLDTALGFALLVLVVEGVSFADMTPRQMAQFLEGVSVTG